MFLILLHNVNFHYGFQLSHNAAFDGVLSPIISQCLFYSRKLDKALFIFLALIPSCRRCLNVTLNVSCPSLFHNAMFGCALPLGNFTVLRLFLVLALILSYCRYSVAHDVTMPPLIVFYHSLSHNTLSYKCPVLELSSYLLIYCSTSTFIDFHH